MFRDQIGRIVLWSGRSHRNNARGKGSGNEK
jgi:hypothetical protein